MSNNSKSTTKAVFAYYTNWSIYARNYPPMAIPTDHISHILYAFFHPHSDGAISLTDKWADVDKRFPGDRWDEPGNNLYGNFKQLGKMKKERRSLKVLMSVGGWTLSSGFKQLASNEASRKKFAKQAVKWIEDLGLDGVDLDWVFSVDSK